VPAEDVPKGKAVVIFTAGFSSGFTPNPNDFLSPDGKKVIKPACRQAGKDQDWKNFPERYPDFVLFLSVPNMEKP